MFIKERAGLSVLFLYGRPEVVGISNVRFM